ncbi:MAG TPA: hypothetical protein PKM73_01970 [Verrucomicrobiota bacterium]|nr:hypothetical protein [Verrucomicrobiota bacterium]HNU50318.1 hypothetical protein [Verrucomicrobiota bacterium]
MKQHVPTGIRHDTVRFFLPELADTGKLVALARRCLDSGAVVIPGYGDIRSAADFNRLARWTEQAGVGLAPPRSHIRIAAVPGELSAGRILSTPHADFAAIDLGATLHEVAVVSDAGTGISLRDLVLGDDRLVLVPESLARAFHRFVVAELTAAVTTDSGRSVTAVLASRLLPNRDAAGLVQVRDSLRTLAIQALGLEQLAVADYLRRIPPPWSEKVRSREEFLIAAHWHGDSDWSPGGTLPRLEAAGRGAAPGAALRGLVSRLTAMVLLRLFMLGDAGARAAVASRLKWDPTTKLLISTDHWGIEREQQPDFWGLSYPTEPFLNAAVYAHFMARETSGRQIPIITHGWQRLQTDTAARVLETEAERLWNEGAAGDFKVETVESQWAPTGLFPSLWQAGVDTLLDVAGFSETERWVLADCIRLSRSSLTLLSNQRAAPAVPLSPFLDSLDLEPGSALFDVELDPWDDPGARLQSLLHLVRSWTPAKFSLYRVPGAPMVDLRLVGLRRGCRVSPGFVGWLVTCHHQWSQAVGGKPVLLRTVFRRWELEHVLRVAPSAVHR